MLSLGGAEINAVELADQLVKFGMKPTFFSYDIDGPLRDYIESKFKTKVLSDKVKHLAEYEDSLDVTKLNINDYDYIWVGGNTIPISIIKQINSTKTLPKFIFIHMSPLIAFPLDSPMMPRLEKSIASRILSISENTTKHTIHRVMGVDTSVSDWRNPVPKEFSEVKIRSGDLQRIAVVSSSHPTEEIIKMGQIVESQGVEVDYIGRFNNSTEFVDADFYSKYDLVVGIGKNARYSLVSGVPIYVYGRFGGPGYLTHSDPVTLKTHNLSGRGHGRMSADCIAEDIVSNYKEALEFHKKNRKKFIDRNSLDTITAELFTSVEAEECKSVDFDDQYISWLVSAQINLMQRVQLSASRRSIAQKNVNTKAQASRLKMENKKLSRQLKVAKEELRRIQGSKSWTITKPLRRVGVLVKKVMR